MECSKPPPCALTNSTATVGYNIQIFCMRRKLKTKLHASHDNKLKELGIWLAEVMVDVSACANIRYLPLSCLFKERLTIATFSYFKHWFFAQNVWYFTSKVLFQIWQTKELSCWLNLMILVLFPDVCVKFVLYYARLYSMIGFYSHSRLVPRLLRWKVTHGAYIHALPAVMQFSCSVCWCSANCLRELCHLTSFQKIMFRSGNTVKFLRSFILPRKLANLIFYKSDGTSKAPYLVFILLVFNLIGFIWAFI